MGIRVSKMQIQNNDGEDDGDWYHHHAAREKYSLKRKKFNFNLSNFKFYIKRVEIKKDSNIQISASPNNGTASEVGGDMSATMLRKKQTESKIVISKIKI